MSQSIISIRMSKDLLERIDAVAAFEERKRSGMIALLLERALADRRYEYLETKAVS